MNIPNSLTLVRIGLIPVFVAAFYSPLASANAVTATIFAVAALTDWLDGYLARRLGQISRLGQFLDPVADKLMVAVVLVFILQRHPTVYVALAAAVIIGREITISALREWMAELGARRKVAVSSLGKIKTIAQMTALVLLLFEDPIGVFPTYSMGLALLYIAAALTLWSMCVYLSAAWPDITGAAES
jgi:CDP-diacylglycerol--glycerol-3-phosphate 3-phosphatidyltransferase